MGPLQPKGTAATGHAARATFLHRASHGSGVVTRPCIANAWRRPRWTAATPDSGDLGTCFVDRQNEGGKGEDRRTDEALAGPELRTWDATLM